LPYAPLKKVKEIGEGDGGEVAALSRVDRIGKTADDRWGGGKKTCYSKTNIEEKKERLNYEKSQSGETITIHGPLKLRFLKDFQIPRMSEKRKTRERSKEGDTTA